MNEWDGFQGERWKKRVDVEDFIINNYKEYRDDVKFLKGASKKTNKLWSRCQKILDKEMTAKVLDVETTAIAGIDTFETGFIDKKYEVIVGLQTDEPLKRIVNPFGGIENARQSLFPYGYHLDHDIEEKFAEFRKTYYDGIKHAYTNKVKLYKDNNVIATLPEEYGRGKILGDYRRLALYGADYLINRKQHDLDRLTENINFSMIRAREEVSEQIEALEEMKWMASRYDIDISRPASNAKEAFQWLYFAYLANVKQNNGVINSIGRNTAFLDIYIERDLERKLITEEEAQELVDQFIMKLRLVRHLRKNDYREALVGDPTWITESIGGMSANGTSFVTKTSYRFLHSLVNLGSSPEPNMTILWSPQLPEPFKRFVSKLAIDTHVIQFVNDDLLRPIYGSDYAITGACTAVPVGKRLVYYGGSCNLPKLLLYAINGGKDEITGDQVVEGLEEIKDDYLPYQPVVKNFVKCMTDMIGQYVDAQSVVHYMQDKYAYESAPMAFMDTVSERMMSFGVTGISTVADSLSAIRYGKVKVIRDENGNIQEFQVDHEFPRYGNNDEHVDRMVSDILKIFAKTLKKKHLYRNSIGQISLQTIADNVYYGAHTGATPDGRLAHQPFAPGASPVNGVDITGASNSLKSVAKVPFDGVCMDGIANNIIITPSALGKKESEKQENFLNLVNEYFTLGGEHLNISIQTKNDLFEIKRNPSKNYKMIVRYAECGVRFTALSRNQQEELMSRTFHEKI